MSGDYNQNGVADAADYVLWRKNLGTNTTLPNDDTPGVVAQDDYDRWRAHFGQTAPAVGAAAGQAVPDVFDFFAPSQAQPDLLTTASIQPHSSPLTPPPTHDLALLAWLSTQPVPTRDIADNSSPTPSGQINNAEPDSDLSIATIDSAFDSPHVLPTSLRLRASA